MSSNREGDRRERELVDAPDKVGPAVMHAPASENATTCEFPDVLVGNGEMFYAIEARASSGHPIYLSGEEVEAFAYFSWNFDVKARVAARFNREGWYFFHPGDPYVAGGRNYRVKKETALAEDEGFGSFIDDPTQTKLGGD